MKAMDWKPAEEMIENSFELQCGRHTIGRGYFATFVDAIEASKSCKDCPDVTNNCDHRSCGRYNLGLNWTDAAHHLILSEAIKMAARMANGEQVDIPDSKDFE